MPLGRRRAFALLAILCAFVAMPAVGPKVTEGVPVAGRVLAPAPAFADECTWKAAGICGRFKNYSNHGVGIVNEWGKSWEKILAPGQTTDKSLGWADADGIYVGRGYAVQVYDPYSWYKWYGPGYHKFPDLPPYMYYDITAVKRI